MNTRHRIRQTARQRTPRLMGPALLMGLSLASLSLNAHGFLWQAAQTGNPARPNTAAVFEHSEHLRYQLEGQCRADRPEAILSLQIEANAALSTELNKYYPDQGIPTQSQQQTNPIAVEVTFDWAAASNPWYATGTLEDDTYRLTLNFDKQSYYTKRVRQLLSSASYLNLKIRTPDRPQATFTTSIPLNGLKAHLNKVTRCERMADTPKPRESIDNNRPTAYIQPASQPGHPDTGSRQPGEPS